MQSQSHFHSLFQAVSLLALLLVLPTIAQGQSVGSSVSLNISIASTFPRSAIVRLPVEKKNADGTEPISYPASAAEEGMEGTVKLKVLIGNDGTVRQSETIESGGDSRLLRAAVEGLRNAGFTPGTVDDKPTEMWVIIEVTFAVTSWDVDDLHSSAVTGTQRTTSSKNKGSGYIEEPIYDREDLTSLVKYPDVARQFGLEGYVIVNAEVDADGSVLQVEVQEASSHIFEQSALDAVKKLEFVAGMENGHPARLWKAVYVPFRLSVQEKEDAISDDAGMDDFIPNATLPEYDQAELLNLLRDEFPSAAIGEKIVVSAQIDTDGKVLKVIVRSTTDSTLIEPTISAVKKGKFTPGKQGGQPIRLWVTITLETKKSSVGE